MLKIGLAGVGYLGCRHLKHLIEMEGVRVSGIWDIDPEKMRDASSEFGVSPARSLDDLIKSSDAIDIVTPTSTHFDIAWQCMENGKPVFIEKPICAAFDQGKKLVELSKKLGIPVQVGHIERFNRAFRSIQRTPVDPHFIEAHRLALWTPRGVDVSVVYDLMIHDLDIILSLSKAKPVHLHANGVGVITDTVDIANARIEFDAGLVANVTASRISLKKMRKLRLFGDNEYIALDMAKGSCEYIGVCDNEDNVPENALPLGTMDIPGSHRIIYQKMLEVEEADAMRLELESFRDAIINETEPTVTGEDGLRALDLAEQIVKQIEKAQPGLTMETLNL